MMEGRMSMKFCSACGNALIMKKHEHEGCIPYCTTCQKYIFPQFNTAVSLVALSPDEKQILLIQQYGKQRNVLVAGYVNQKESVEDAVCREMQEEIGRRVAAYRYLKSEYFEKTNTLMLSFAVLLDSTSLADVSDWEIDEAKWYSFDEALEAIAPASLAQRFLLNFIHCYEKEAKGNFFK